MVRSCKSAACSLASFASDSSSSDPNRSPFQTPHSRHHGSRSLKLRRPTDEVCVLFAVLTCPQCATTCLEVALTPTDQAPERYIGDHANGGAGSDGARTPPSSCGSSWCS